jgi:hypothetical protein
VLSCKTRQVKHRATTALRMGANSLCRAKGYFGEFFRRMGARLGTAQAITAPHTKSHEFSELRRLPPLPNSSDELRVASRRTE